MRARILKLEESIVTRTDDQEQVRILLSNKLKQSFKDFLLHFFKLINRRDFVISQPISRKPKELILIDALERCEKHELKRLAINIPPRYGKTTACIYFVAWCLAKHPNANFIYVSYSHLLASYQTKQIRDIVSSREFNYLFNVSIDKSSNAKDFFETTAGGAIRAVGEGGSITGFGAGIAYSETFGGAIIIDDIHKTSEVFSELRRDAACDLYKSTLRSRLNNQKTPIIFIGQRLHSDDLPARLEKKWDGEKWTFIKLEALDENNNVLDSAHHSREQLNIMQQHSPYEYWSQYQQSPQPSGGGIFRRAWFDVLQQEELPKFDFIFIVADTAETDKIYNDASAFTLFGCYVDQLTHVPVLVVLKCIEERVEPKDLQDIFLNFYRASLIFGTPRFVAIEKKSTGTTLISVLKTVTGVNIVEIERSRASGSKIARFSDCQPYIARRQLKVVADPSFCKLFLDHMGEITFNETHKNDDICDTVSDAIKLVLIDQQFLPDVMKKERKYKPIKKVKRVTSWS